MIIVKKFSLTLISILSTVFAFSASVSAEDIHIYYYSAMPEVIRDGGRPGLPEVATMVEDARTNNPNTIFVHGGASLGPSILGALDRGAHMIDLLNLMEPDLMGVGKREFSYKEEQFSLYAITAGFPFLASNLMQRDVDIPVDGIERSVILEAGPINIGFLALTSDNVVTQYGAKAIRVLDKDKTIEMVSADLRQQGADIIVALADTDYNDLGEHTANGTVDVILYAHNEDNPYSVDTRGALLTKGALDGHMVIVTIKVADKGSPGIEATTVPLAGVPEDPTIQALIDSYATRLQVMLKKVVGETKTSFTTLRNEVRTGENPFGNLVADAIREAMQADIAFLNSGGIRGNRRYEAGDQITREDIQQELPFNNIVELYEVTGLQLLEALEHGAACLDEVDGCFLQVSNMRVTFDMSQPPGSRVRSAEINGEPLAGSQTYKLGTLNFLANGGDGFSILQGSPRLTRADSGKLLWEVVANYLADKTTIAPQMEGRLTFAAGTNQPDSRE